jgi:hypothetical protein
MLARVPSGVESWLAGSAVETAVDCVVFVLFFWKGMGLPVLFSFVAAGK